MKYIFIILIFLISCGKEVISTAEKHENDLTSLFEKRDLYLELIKERQGEHGFINSNNCDSLLFSSLSVFAGVRIDIKRARDERTGQWYRTTSKDCYLNEQADIKSPRRSKSTISGDMFAGLLLALYHLRELVVLEELLKYGKDNHWIMGEGVLSRTWMNPLMQRTLYMLVGKTFKGLPDVWFTPDKDHDRHVVALHILLRGLLTGHLDEGKLNIIKTFRRDDLGNPLFQFIYHYFSDGDQTETIAILNNEQLYPRFRLPESKDRCARWIPERGESYRLPCPDENLVHSGGDLLFLVKLLELAKK